MSKTIFVIIASLAIACIVSEQQAQAILEDEGILCLADLSTEKQGDLVCSLYTLDSILDSGNRTQIEHQIHNNLDTFSPKYLN